MSRRIRDFSDGTYIEFSTGGFDSWLVSIFAPDGRKASPKDEDYFNALVSLAKIKTNKEVYDDFIIVYDLAGDDVNANDFITIDSISNSYGTKSLYASKVFSILYATMIAENNRKNAKLKKRIKRLGVHMLLIENVSPHNAAIYSYEKHIPELSKDCENRGF